jgi:CRISPR/Cas system-associated exonuclease Cas4 (RecB family)
MFRNPSEIIPEEQSGLIKATSYSGIKQFEKCPHALFLNKVERVPMVGSTAMDRGSQLHLELEEYINGTLPDLTDAGRHYSDLMKSFHTAYQEGQCTPEEKWAFNTAFEEVDWMAFNCWIRIILDVRVMHSETSASIYDFKSGKWDGDPAGHRSQLMLYAMFTFLKFPKLEHIRAAPIYIDHKKDLHYAEYTRADLETFLPNWLKRITTVTTATEFPPKPSQWSCKWCQHAQPQEALGQEHPSCEYGFQQ